MDNSKNTISDSTISDVSGVPSITPANLRIMRLAAYFSAGFLSCVAGCAQRPSLPDTKFFNGSEQAGCFNLANDPGSHIPLDTLEMRRVPLRIFTLQSPGGNDFDSSPFVLEKLIHGANELLSDAKISFEIASMEDVDVSEKYSLSHLFSSRESRIAVSDAAGMDDTFRVFVLDDERDTFGGSSATAAFYDFVTGAVYIPFGANAIEVAHELSHAIGLFHLQEEENPCPDNLADDCLVDTPLDPGVENFENDPSCSYVASECSAVCDDKPAPDVSNLMSYYPYQSGCERDLTEGQKQFMNCMLTRSGIANLFGVKNTPFSDPTEVELPCDLNETLWNEAFADAIQRSKDVTVTICGNNNVDSLQLIPGKTIYYDHASITIQGRPEATLNIKNNIDIILLGGDDSVPTLTLKNLTLSGSGSTTIYAIGKSNVLIDDVTLGSGFTSFSDFIHASEANVTVTNLKISDSADLLRLANLSSGSTFVGSNIDIGSVQGGKIDINLMRFESDNSDSKFTVSSLYSAVPVVVNVINYSSDVGIFNYTYAPGTIDGLICDTSTVSCE